MNAPGHRRLHPLRTDGATDVEPRIDLPDSTAARPVVSGRVEKLMRVRHLMEHTPDVLGVRMAVMDTGHWVLDLDGRPTGAAAAVILDNTLAASIRINVDELHWMVTTELHLNFMRRLPTDGTVLEAWTRTLVGDEAGGMSIGTLRGPDGTEYVQAAGWFQGVEGNTPEGLDRYEAMAKQPLGAAEAAHLGALLAAKQVTPALPGGRPETTEGFVRGLGFSRMDELQNSHGAIHGGALMIMASLAAQMAMPDRVAYDLQSLRVAYLRPASGTIASRTRVRHAGSTLRVVDVELFSGETGSTAKAFVQATAMFRTAR
jgi:acyl-coenzyme A thioesterase PaaI-like protein